MFWLTHWMNHGAKLVYFEVDSKYHRYLSTLIDFFRLSSTSVFFCLLPCVLPKAPDDTSVVRKNHRSTLPHSYLNHRYFIAISLLQHRYRSGAGAVFERCFSGGTSVSDRRAIEDQTKRKRTFLSFWPRSIPHPAATTVPKAKAGRLA